MSDSNINSTVRLGKGQPTVSAPQSGVSRRIDGEHGVDLAHFAAEERRAFLAELPSEPISDRIPRLTNAAIETHAKDLAAQLAARGRDLDLRESRLHRQLLLLDQERQAARLDLSERELEIETRIAMIGKREQEIADQLRRCATAEEGLRAEAIAAREQLEAKKRALAQDYDLLHREQERLRSQSAGVEIAHRKLQEDRASLQHDADSTRQSLHRERSQFEQSTKAVLAEIQQRQADLEELQNRIASQQRELAAADRTALEADRASLKRAEAEYVRLAAQVEAELRELARRREAHDEDCRNERRRLLLERETMQLEHGRRQAEIHKRQTALEDAQAALESTQAELLEQQRSMLEERLAVEQATQAFARSAGSESAAAIQATRQKLAEHYRWMKESLQTQKVDLLEIAKQLDVREREIVEDRDALQEWAESQQSDLDAQLMQLEAQRQQIHRREAELTERELRWATQKKGLESRLAIAQARAA